ncbi:PrgI family protein [Micromonospora costi]|uniref:PrgI family protein n=1 Tax=Micromonospora costi TaxID=1530042 RepID=UPI0033C0B72D
MSTHADGSDAVRARMPADVDAPDKVVYGLTFRQLAILAVAALAVYGVWRVLHQVVPMSLLVGAAVVLGGLAFGIVVGRRDGLPLDVWLLAAVAHARAPRALSTTDTTSTTPDWVQAPKARVMLPAPLRLPADAIDEGGQIRLGGGRAAVVAASSVNLALRTSDEQSALVEVFGRWLNSLSTPTQIVVSAQPVDLHSAAHTLSQAKDGLPHPALADAAADHARFLDDLAARRDPLRRQVLIVTRTSAGERGDHAARRRAENTVRTLSGLGVTTRVLDGAAVTAAIAAAADPYRPPRPGGLAAPDTVITSPAPQRRNRPRSERA